MSQRTSTMEDLVTVLNAGCEAAHKMRLVKDGGTCNLDAAFLRLPRIHADTVAEAGKRAAVDVRESNWHGRIFFVHPVEATGQGARRTAMAEAACRAMEEKIKKLDRPGWSASVFYQMD